MVKILARLIIIGAIFFSGFYFGREQAGEPAGTTVAPLTGQESGPAASVKAAEVYFDFGNGEVKNSTPADLPADATAFDALMAAAEKEGMAVEYEDYGGELGVMVESIGGVKNDFGANRWWQYWVNGEYGQVGAGSYVIKNDDRVEWKYAEGQME